MINNRQSSRRRGRGGSSQQRSSGSSSGQRDSGNRIDSRARGNAAQLLEKYKNMARDAQMQGDRVQVETYLQFADHYFRVLADSRQRSDDHRPIRPVDDFDGSDEEYGDEGEPIRSGEQAGDSRQYQPQGREPSRDQQQPRDNQRDYQSRDQQPREQQYRDQSRDQQQRDYQPRDSQPRDSQSRDQQPREQQSRDQQPRRDDRQRRDAAPRDDNHGNREGSRGNEAAREERVVEQPAAQASSPAYRGPVANDLEEAVTAPVEVAAEAKPPRRTRTRKPTPGDEPQGMDADRLPPALGAAVGAPVASGEASAGDESAEAKPKRRRRSSSVGEVQTG